jgi:hypothetical protein
MHAFTPKRGGMRWEDELQKHVAEVQPAFSPIRKGTTSIYLH